MTDSPIRFPGLFGDWAFTASGVAFHIDGKAIYWYGIIIALGVVLALWFCMTQREKYGITEDDLLDAVLWGVPLAIVGARLYYVIFYLDLFKKADGSFDWGSAIAIWDGGLAIYGGVIAAFLTGFVLCRKKGIKMGALTDLVVMGFLIGQAVGRWRVQRMWYCPWRSCRYPPPAGRYPASHTAGTHSRWCRYRIRHTSCRSASAR